MKKLSKARESFLLKKHFVSGNPVTLKIQCLFVSTFREIDRSIEETCEKASQFGSLSIL